MSKVGQAREQVGHGTVRYSTVRKGTVRYGTVRYGQYSAVQTARYRRYGTARYGTIFFRVRVGLAGFPGFRPGCPREFRRLRRRTVLTTKTAVRILFASPRGSRSGKFSGIPARIFNKIPATRPKDLSNYENGCSEHFSGLRGSRQVFRDSGPDFQ